MRSPNVHVLGGLDRRLVAPGPAARFETVRTGLAVVLGIRLALRHWSAAAAIPDPLFRRAFAVAWLPSVPPGWLLNVVAVVGVVGAMAVVARMSPRIGFVVAWLALLFVAGVWGSAGKIMHNDVLLLLTAVPFVVAKGGTANTRDGADRSVADGWPPRAALMIIAAVYFIAGVQKLHHSGLAWISGDHMAWVLRQGAAGAASPFPGLARSIANTPPLPFLIVVGSIVFELAAPLMLWWRRGRIPFAVGAACLHGAIWLTIGLDYYGWILTVAAVAVPLGRPIQHRKKPA